MREDMAKVITERPRGGGRGVPESAVYRRNVHWGRFRADGREDESPRREGIGGLKWADRERHFSDLLGPIVGFLRKSAGRPWDAVWSELCASLDSGSTTQRHVLEHVTRDLVVLHTRLGERGEPCRATGEPLLPSRSPHRGRHGLFYVCPRTRRLVHEPPRGRPRTSWRRPPAVDVATPHHLLAGQWYEVRFATLTGPAWDAMFRRPVTPPARSWAPGSHWKDGGLLYAASKRQLSRRELRRLGLGRSGGGRLSSSGPARA